MPRYALLVAPSANRVYANQAARLARAELSAFGAVLSAPVTDVAEERIGNVAYLGFTAALTDRDVAYLSALSVAQALFERVEPDLLRPLALDPPERYDDDLITIPKYAGKTNEQLTRLLLNVTLLASADAHRMLDGQLTVLDPLCGRGTTLNQALMYGHDGIGVEIDGKDVDAYRVFLQTWLKRKRLKHSVEMVPVRRNGRRVARRLEVTLSPSRDDHRAGNRQHVTVLHADATQLDGLLRANCADVLVADVPYGVAHGSVGASGDLSRRPLDLLERAVPQWCQLVRPDGALGLSWNTRVAGRERVEDVLRGHGLDVVALGDLAHRVDQSIERDVIVARRPGVPGSRPGVPGRR